MSDAEFVIRSSGSIRYNMWKLLFSKRFGPFFWTQFWGAFNDNLFKNALVILITLNAVNQSESGFMVNLAAGLFILPFFLFSPIAGQLSDKYEKAKLIRMIKFSEIIIMLLGAIGFYFGHLWFLISILFLMGTQSSFFGPVKYSILPQNLDENELMTGTSLVEMGTFIAILAGTILGGIMINMELHWLMLSIICFSLIGWFSSCGIPETQASDPLLKLDYNPKTEFVNLYKISRQSYSIFLSIVGISWFWFLGATILSQIPIFVKHNIGENEALITLFLSVFTLSVAIGSIVSDKVADSSIELGIVPIGALGISFCMFDMGIIDYANVLTKNLSLPEFLYEKALWPHYRVLLDIGGIGFFGSFFIVPLYALLQHRSQNETCSRVIAANNVANSIFMVFSAIVAMALYQVGFKTTDIFIVISLMNIAICVYLFVLLPEFIIRLILWLLAKTIYTLKYQGRKNIPKTGPVLLISNHVSFIDWFIITAACQRPVRFVMDHTIFKVPFLNLIFKYTRSIPIAPAKEDPECKENAFKNIQHALSLNEVVCIFPEGQITHDGKLVYFKKGIERIITENDVIIVPMAINGLWGSFFSRYHGKAMSTIPIPRRRKIQVNIGEPILSKQNPTSLMLENIVKNLQTKET